MFTRSFLPVVRRGFSHEGAVNLFEGYAIDVGGSGQRPRITGVGRVVEEIEY